MTFFGAISKKQIPLALAVLLAILCAAFFFERARHATVDLEALATQEMDCELSLNWAKASNRKLLRIYPHITNYRFTARNFHHRQKFSITLVTEGKPIRLRRVVIYQPGSPKVELAGEQLLESMSSTQGASAHLDENGDIVVMALRTSPSARAAELTFSNETPWSKGAWFAWVISRAATLWIILLFFVDLGMRRFAGLKKPPSYVPPMFAILAAIACVLILCLSLTSAFNAHPDEVWHTAATSYFLFDHYPAANPTTQSAESVSLYGSSYLASADICYWIGARWTSILSTLTDLPFDQLQMDRLLSVIAFAILVWLLSRRSNQGMLLSFLVTPQLWYIFSYVNNDWFGVAVATCLILFLNSSRVTFHRFAVTGSVISLFRLLPIAVLLVFLYFSKPNYWVCAILCLYDPAIRLFRKNTSWSSRLRVLIFCAGLLFLSVGCVLLKNSVSHETIRRVPLPASKAADRSTAESIELFNRKSQTEKLFEHHIAIWNMLIKRQWIWLSCRSFFGDFGWMKFHLSLTYYHVAIAAFVALVVCALVSSRTESNFRLVLSFAFLVFAANICSAAGYSWFFDLQPQGRYLFPSLLAFGWMLSRLRGWQKSRIVRSLALLMALFAVYSFVCYALIPLKSHVPASFL
jgi:Predicted membrane protein (DUF2142)